MATSEIEPLNEVAARTHGQIRAYIAGLGIAPHVVDDLAQEVYLQVRGGMDKLPADADGEIRWLKGIAKRVCANHLRRTARRHRVHEEAIQELLVQTDSPLEGAAAAHMHGALRECMAKLPKRDRELLRMRYAGERDDAELAAATSRSQGTLRVHLHRLRQTLRRCIRITLEA